MAASSSHDLSHRRNRRLWLVLLVPVGMVACAVFFSEDLSYLAITLSGAVYDSGAAAFVWDDTNADGQWQEGENPVEDVCIWASTSRPLSPTSSVPDFCHDDPEHYHHTDARGRWPHMDDKVGVFSFFAGAKCSDIYIELLEIPFGYASATATVVNGCHAEFGLKRSQDQPSG